MQRLAPALAAALTALTLWSGVARAAPRWETLPPPAPLPPFQLEGRVTHEGAGIWFAAFGAGPPVILLHGGDASSDYWGDQVPALLVDGRHTGKKPCVETDGILMSGQLRRHVSLHFLQHGIGVRASDPAEGGQRSLQELPSLLHGHERIFEGRRRRIVSNCLYLGELLGHARLDGWLIVFIFDLVEGRRVERQGTWRIKRV